jgi:hypothetical protein
MRVILLLIGVIGRRGDHFTQRPPLAATRLRARRQFASARSGAASQALVSRVVRAALSPRVSAKSAWATYVVDWLQLDLNLAAAVARLRDTRPCTLRGEPARPSARNCNTAFSLWTSSPPRPLELLSLRNYVIDSAKETDVTSGMPIA